MSSTRDSQLAQKPKTAKPTAKQATLTPNRSGTQPGSPAQLLQLQRQYGNQAVQQTIQREATRQPAGAQQRVGQPTIQRLGVNEQATYNQPNNTLGVNADPLKTEQTPDAALQAQVKQLIDHAVIASADFKELITEVVDFVNFQIPGGCVNGDPGFGHVTKGLQGAIEKAQGRMQGKTVGQMSDVLRGTVKCNSVQALTIAQDYLDDRAARLMALTEISVGGTQKKDMFAPDKSKGQGPGDMVGYGDIKYITPVIHWLFNQSLSQSPQSQGFWMYAEIQLMTDKMNAKKMQGGGHTFYDLNREVKETVSPSGNVSYRIPATDNTAHATHDLLANHMADLKRGVNLGPLATLLPKLRELEQGHAIELTKAEYDGLELAGEIIYRKERVEGNIERQGLGAGKFTV